MIATFRLLVTLLFGVSACASAQTIYRCESEGQVTYRDRGCTRGVEQRIEPVAAPPAEATKSAAARLQAAVAEFDARHPVRVSGIASRASDSESLRGASGVNASRPNDDSTWCIERDADTGNAVGDFRRATLLVRVPVQR